MASGNDFLASGNEDPVGRTVNKLVTDVDFSEAVVAARSFRINSEDVSVAMAAFRTSSDGLRQREHLPNSDAAEPFHSNSALGWNNTSVHWNACRQQ